MLEKDNELLRNAKVVYENVDYCYEDLKKAEKRIAELEKENAKLLDSVETVQSNRCVYKCVLTKEHLTKFAEKLKEKAIRRQEFIGELAIDDIEYVKTQDIDETLKEYLCEK